MRLVIVSDMPHHRGAAGVVGWGPTVQELTRLAQLFEEVRHVAFLYDGAPPPSMLPYDSSGLRVIPIPPSGGNTLARKLDALVNVPRYLWTIAREIRRADVVHVRCPATPSLLAIVYLALRRRPHRRWIKYAGNWSPGAGDPWTYRLQRWWLRSGFAGGVVTVNGSWPDQPPHVRAFLNPCIDATELEAARQIGERKEMSTPIQLLFVGRLESLKGIERAIRIVAGLRDRDCAVSLDVVGTGPSAERCEELVSELDLAARIHFHGPLPRSALAALYARAHFVLLPTAASEGWPKVLSEGMAYGAVPLSTRVSSIPQYLRSFGAGRAFEPHDIDAYVDAIREYEATPQLWKTESDRALEAAPSFTYERYLEAVRRLLDEQNGGQGAGEMWPLPSRVDA